MNYVSQGAQPVRYCFLLGHVSFNEKGPIDFELALSRTMTKLAFVSFERR